MRLSRDAVSVDAILPAKVPQSVAALLNDPADPQLIDVRALILLDQSGKLIDLNYSRHKLTEGKGRPVIPGETVTMKIAIPPPPQGRYLFVFDLVSEGICWFGANGSPPVSAQVVVT